MQNKTDKLCFSNGTEFEVWMSHNCENCAKYTHFNDRAGEYPKYRCAIQRDIEMQYVTSCEVNQVSFDAAQKRDCPFFKDRTKRKKYHKKEKGTMEMTFE